MSYLPKIQLTAEAKAQKRREVEAAVEAQYQRDLDQYRVRSDSHGRDGGRIEFAVMRLESDLRDEEWYKNHHESLLQFLSAPEFSARTGEFWDNEVRAAKLVECTGEIARLKAALDSKKEELRLHLAAAPIPPVRAGTASEGRSASKPSPVMMDLSTGTAGGVSGGSVLNNKEI
jgi:hypothetical protein